MIILAIEQSTSVGSIAVLDGASVMVERNWMKNGNSMYKSPFSILSDLCRKASVELSDIDIFAVGLGPGSFTGLRMSLAAANAFALPGKKPVLGISSGKALAYDIFQETASTSVTIVGDARRGRLWFAQFKKKDELPQMTTSYSVIKFGEFPFIHNNESIVATSDWSRIGEKLKQLISRKATLIQEPRMPRAQTVGKLALRNYKTQQTQNTAPAPIYLHPPVAEKKTTDGK